jgi:hypothetical protein
VRHRVRPRLPPRIAVARGSTVARIPTANSRRWWGQMMRLNSGGLRVNGTFVSRTGTKGRLPAGGPTGGAAESGGHAHLGLELQGRSDRPTSDAARTSMLRSAWASTTNTSPRWTPTVWRWRPSRAEPKPGSILGLERARCADAWSTRPPPPTRGSCSKSTGPRRLNRPSPEPSPVGRERVPRQVRAFMAREQVRKEQGTLHES